MNATASRNGKPSANGTSRNGHAAPVPDATAAPSFNSFIKGGEPRSLPSTADGRDPATGRFLKGYWKGGNGNPFFRRCAQLRAQAVCEITPDEVRALMRRLYVQAMSGDIAASVVVLGYLLGKPAKVVDPDAVDDDQWRRLRDVPSPAEFTVASANAIPTDAAIGKLQMIREHCDPFDNSSKSSAGLLLEEIHAQRRRRK
jgi:hypothetical protein